MGDEWKNGQDFKPPPEWKHQHFDTESAQGEFTNSKGFSDFFEALFRANTGQQGQSNDFAYGSWNLRGQDHEAKIEEMNGHGDLYACITIVMPQTLTQKQMELFVELSKISDFNPRDS